MQKTKNLDKEPIFFIKINSKWTIDLNVKHKATKLLQENGKVDDLEHSNNLTDTVSKLRFMKLLRSKSSLKLKIFCSGRQVRR